MNTVPNPFPDPDDWRPDDDDITGKKHGGNPESNTAFERSRESAYEGRIKLAQMMASRRNIICDEADAINLLGCQNSTSARLSEMKRDGLVRVVTDKDGKKVTRVTRTGSPAAVLELTTSGEIWLDSVLNPRPEPEPEDPEAEE
jgi:hypothetical protein